MVLQTFIKVFKYFNVFIALILIFSSLAVAKPITLYDLNITTPNQICINEDVEIIIMPMMLNGSLSEVDSMNISLNNIKQEPYFSINHYGFEFKPTEVSNQTLNIFVSQDGKTLNKTFNIQTQDCKDFSVKINKVENFVRNNFYEIIYVIMAFVGIIGIVIILKFIK